MEIQPRQATIIQIEQEYNQKVKSIKDNLERFEQSITDLQSNSCIQGHYGGLVAPNTIGIHYQSILNSLKTSAWQLAFRRCGMDRLASESEKKKFEQSLLSPPEFTLENCLNTFGDHVSNPRASMLNSFAEVFTTLDQSYKSHEKVKIGVSKLPKRIILSNADDTYGWGFDRLKSILNALAVLEGKPLLDFDEIRRLQKTGRCELTKEEFQAIIQKAISDNSDKMPENINRGVHLKLFKNGNGHLYFEEEQLLNINRALAEYYGDVLPDCPEENPNKKQSTEVSKDLQFYKTPTKLLDYIFDYRLDTYRNRIDDTDKVLEPSCGDGAILDYLRYKGINNIHGIECDYNRATASRIKGHNVYLGNFLDTEPTADYDVVFMNPPFYGKHYVKHVEHAKKFLKDGGRLYSILPITARDDHKILVGDWDDLPAKSFTESGTNINTVLYKFTKNAN